MTVLVIFATSVEVSLHHTKTHSFLRTYIVRHTIMSETDLVSNEKLCCYRNYEGMWNKNSVNWSYFQALARYFPGCTAMSHWVISGLRLWPFNPYAGFIPISFACWSFLHSLAFSSPSSLPYHFLTYLNCPLYCHHSSFPNKITLTLFSRTPSYVSVNIQAPKVAFVHNIKIYCFENYQFP